MRKYRGTCTGGEVEIIRKDWGLENHKKRKGGTMRKDWGTKLERGAMRKNWEISWMEREEPWERQGNQEGE
jgi:hypothetical protein